jgi:UDPglucose 6-dehydrogenase
VPGPDGKFGFGGSCFPKDLNALIAATEELEGDCPLLKAAWNKNLEVRPERDWESLKGRAVVDDENLESGT